MTIDMREAWNKASAHYQQNQKISVDSVYYGPWSPPETELQLLGDLRGKRVLEIGCGGGQSALAMAKQGAIVTAIDVSDEQLRFARNLVQKHKLSVNFVQCAAEEMEKLPETKWDLILSTNVFQYIQRLDPVLRSCYHLLSSRGRLVISQDHPLRSCFIDEEEDELALFPIRSYFDPTPLRWQFSNCGNWMVSYHRTLATWVASIHTTGLRLQKLVEPPLVAEMADELWPLDGPLAALRNIPQTIIFVAIKE